MVRKKNEAAERIARRAEYLQQKNEKMLKNTIRIKWQVIEHTPGYNTGGYYDQDIPAENVVVADNFESEEDAKSWMDKHEPDKGKTLHIKMRRLVRRTYDSWV